ncbi:hypothetical protein KIL84_006940 [Mauremys mutica]|uniref:Uncharacterized protein n=1 Tax=Mauremys mutica TaxID=74926 RepID=A0A9D3X0D1_9SAUR|nr:hypothetical protein KIL84_006940 [Mauremys mutica]
MNICLYECSNIVSKKGYKHDKLNCHLESEHLFQNIVLQYEISSIFCEDSIITILHHYYKEPKVMRRIILIFFPYLGLTPNYSVLQMGLVFGARRILFVPEAP